MGLHVRALTAEEGDPSIYLKQEIERYIKWAAEDAQFGGFISGGEAIEGSGEERFTNTFVFPSTSPSSLLPPGAFYFLSAFLPLLPYSFIFSLFLFLRRDFNSMNRVRLLISFLTQIRPREANPSVGSIVSIKEAARPVR
jgi:hypothetical protein